MRPVLCLCLIYCLWNKTWPPELGLGYRTRTRTVPVDVAVGVAVDVAVGVAVGVALGEIGERQ